MSGVYFSADLHYGHKNVCRFRPFDTPEIHDEYVTDAILSTVGKRDTLWLLGDICFNTESLKHLEQIKEHVGAIRIVLGNHDLHSKYYAHVSDKVYGFTSYKGFWLSHCPVHPQEMYRAKLNIHGHLHDKIVDDERYFCVSLEHLDGYKPIELNQIKNAIAT